MILPPQSPPIQRPRRDPRGRPGQSTVRLTDGSGMPLYEAVSRGESTIPPAAFER
jgi:hypothetical protein